MFSKAKKYYELLLNAEEDARQIRGADNAVIASNERGTALFGTRENPFSFVQDTAEKGALQKLIDAYCAGAPLKTEIKTTDRVYEIHLNKMGDNTLIIAKDNTAAYAIHKTTGTQLDMIAGVLSAFEEPLYLTDKIGNLLYVNKAFCALIGLAYKDILGNHLSSFIIQNCPDFNGIWTDSGLVKTATDSLTFTIQQRPVETKEALFFYGTLKKYIPPVVSSELHLFQESPLPAVIIDALEHRIARVNAAFLNTFKVPEGALENTDVALLFAENMRDSLTGRLAKHLNTTAKNDRLELVTDVPYGAKPFNVFIGFTSPQKDAFILYLIDASERKNLEMQVVHAQKMQAIGQLAGGVAHDFNNLLTAIIGFCDLLLQRHPANDPSFLDIMQIKGNANKASGLVGQLLTFSRKKPSKIQTVNFHDAFVDLSALLQRSIGPFVTLKTDMKRHLGYVKIDPNQLTQIFLNLAVNAKDAMKTGGDLKITATKEKIKKAKPCGNDMITAGDYIKIIVSDTGSGIPAENLSRIFEPFFTTKEGVTGSGTGLGLSTVYGIIRGAGGFISVDSEKGIGTTFQIYLPRLDAKPPEEEEAKPVRSVFTPIQTPTLLLVDDEDGVRMVSARLLKSKGFKVIECANAEQALDVLEKEKDIDVLLTDMIMPGMDGETLIKCARKIDSQMKVILMSGYSEDLARHGSSENKDFAFLAKPFELNELFEKVKEVLEEENT